MYEITDFSYTPLSEYRVVKYLVQNRSKLDKVYDVEEIDSVTSSYGVAKVIEDITLTYVDLDRLVKEAGLSPSERLIINESMEGYSLTEIADVHKIERQTAYTMFNRALYKMIHRNDEIWQEVNCESLARGRCY